MYAIPNVIALNIYHQKNDSCNTNKSNLCPSIILLLSDNASLAVSSGLSANINGAAAYENTFIIPGITNNNDHKNTKKFVIIFNQTAFPVILKPLKASPTEMSSF